MLANQYDVTSKMNSLFTNNIKSPLVLVELSCRQYQRYKNNCIHVTSPYIEDNKTYFKHVSYGEKVIGNTVKRKFDSKPRFHYKEIKCDSIKDRFVYITSELTELKCMFPNMEVIKSDVSRHIFEKDYISSGIIMIGMFMKKDINTVDCQGNKFDCTSLEMLKRCKPNIITKNGQHFGSEGYFYSFGNKGAYERNSTGSTVGQYTTKR